MPPFTGIETLAVVGGEGEKGWKGEKGGKMMEGEKKGRYIYFFLLSRRDF